MVTNIRLPGVAEDETRFGIAGDWHGNWRWGNKCIETFYESGVKTIFQLGDFGIWHGKWGDEYLGKLRAQLEACGDMKIFVTLGNHENYDLIDQMEFDELGIKWPRHNIGLLPRPFRFTQGGYEFLSLGGAPSINYEDLTQGKNWWPQEMISDDEVDLAVEGGSADIMFAHDAPENGTRVVQDIITHNPQGWSGAGTMYARVGRDRMTRAVQAVQPQVFMHGHYHVKDSGWLNYGDDTYPGVIHSIGMDGTPHNIAILDLEDIYSLENAW